MFINSQGLTELPTNFSIPDSVTTCTNMFNGCTALTTAPELPATMLADGCYNSMFYGCTSLNYIKMLATDISASDCLSNWVSGVASTGTFVKNSAATWTKTGTSGVPSGWTIQYKTYS